MISTILGKKIGMTQVFNEKGEAIPVTILEIADGVVVDKKTSERDGYTAVKFGFFDCEKPKRMPKALKGVFKNEKTNKDLPLKKVLKEIRVDAATAETFNVGDTLTIEAMKDLKFVDVCGISKGKGFQGVVKRHNFAGGAGSHGSNHNRAPGSIGSSTYPARVFKNMRMAGHMGVDRVTVLNLAVEKVDLENKFMLIQGAVPGSNNGIVEIRKSVKKK
jgi:large subunit ribosomal protein L3